MKKVLIAILIIVTGLKTIVESGAFPNNYSIFKIAAHEEENKNKEDEKKNGKRYNEDISYMMAELKWIVQIRIISALFVIQQKPYSSYTDKPNTPPPDLI